MTQQRKDSPFLSPAQAEELLRNNPQARADLQSQRLAACKPLEWLRQQEQDQISRMQLRAQREVHNLLQRLKL